MDENRLLSLLEVILGVWILASSNGSFVDFHPRMTVLAEDTSIGGRFETVFSQLLLMRGLNREGPSDELGKKAVGQFPLGLYPPTNSMTHRGEKEETYGRSLT